MSMSRTLVPDEVRNIFGISPVYTKAERKLFEKIEKNKIIKDDDLGDKLSIDVKEKIICTNYLPDVYKRVKTPKSGITTITLEQPYISIERYMDPITGETEDAKSIQAKRKLKKQKIKRFKQIEERRTSRRKKLVTNVKKELQKDAKEINTLKTITDDINEKVQEVPTNTRPPPPPPIYEDISTDTIEDPADIDSLLASSEGDLTASDNETSNQNNEPTVESSESWVQLPIVTDHLRKIMSGEIYSERHKLFLDKRQRNECGGNKISKLHRISNPAFLEGDGKDDIVLRHLMEKVFMKNLPSDTNLMEIGIEEKFRYTNSVLFPEAFIFKFQVKGLSRIQAENEFLKSPIDEEERKVLSKEIAETSKMHEVEDSENSDGDWIDHSDVEDNDISDNLVTQVAGDSDDKGVAGKKPRIDRRLLLRGGEELKGAHQKRFKANKITFVDTEVSEEKRELDQYDCLKCGKVFKSVTHLDKHRRTHTTNEHHQCIKCGESFEHQTQWADHINMSRKRQRCAKISSIKKALNDHTKTHISRIPFQCAMCGKGFDYQSYLDVHMERHLRKPFSCAQCGKNFTSKKSLVRHRKTCGKVFQAKLTPKDHGGIHYGYSPQQCNICARSFSTLTNLRHHLRTNQRCQQSVKVNDPKTKYSENWMDEDFMENFHKHKTYKDIITSPTHSVQESNTENEYIMLQDLEIVIENEKF